MSNSQAYASALERAKQVSTKISDETSPTQTGIPSSTSAGMKRGAPSSIEDTQHHNNPYPSSEKRPFLNDRSSASAAAAEAVARLNQKLGVQQMPNQFAPQSTMPTAASQGISSVTITIPDRMVGLIIGKRGEQITSLQAETHCKVQITQEQTGPERPITLTGTTMQIEMARKSISDIISRAERSTTGFNNLGGGAAGPVSGGAFAQVELRIPGNKAGLVIGKGGETIKALQEEHGVKMVLIQQSNMATAEDKPLSISGDPARVERVKAIVMELINSKGGPMIGGGPGGGGGGHRYGGGDSQDYQRYAVPAEKAGLVIGKGGETIKEICRLTNCHVEISKEPPPSPALKLFNIRGSPQDIENAKKMISERAGIPMTKPADAYAASGYNNYAYMPDATQASAYAANGSMPPPSINPYTGQPDYSAAWIDYYRKLGMHDQAEKIALQAQNMAAAALAGQNAYTQQAAAPAAPASAGAGQAAPSQAEYQAQWQQWQNMQLWQQQQQWGGQQAASTTSSAGQAN